jgi:hypothetical protein
VVNLPELGSREAHCKAEMDRAQRAVADREDVQAWAQAELRQIHRCYSTLAQEDSAEALEALKRGLFLQWFECAEPSFLTGIAGLDEAAALAIIGQLEKALVETRADVELGQMVGYYFAVADWCLNRYPIGPATRALAAESPPVGFLTSDSQRATYPGRGLMGDYFLSLRPRRDV